MKHYDAGKGDRYRDVDKKKYDETYIRCFGKKCPDCAGDQTIYYENEKEVDISLCPTCNGVGKVDKNYRKDS